MHFNLTNPNLIIGVVVLADHRCRRCTASPKSQKDYGGFSADASGLSTTGLF
jgi:hypothetical protein